MNKKLTTIWGVGLVVVLLASLLVGTIPVSGKNLDFTPETLPSGTNSILVNGSAIKDLAVSPDGQTVYAAAGTSTIYRSTNAGAGWTTVLSSAGGVDPIAADFIAVAPDDSNLVAIANATDNYTVYLSENGGNTWGSLSTVGTIESINAIALSSDYSGNNYLAVAGEDSGGLGKVYIRKLGIGGSWTDIGAKNGFNTTSQNSAGAASNILNVQAVAFSPNFSSDQVLVAATDNANASLEMYSVNLESWNAAAGFDNFPVTIKDSSNEAITGATTVDLALAPTYLGGDEVERVVFVGVNGGAATNPGVYRVEDYIDKHIKTTVNIYSVAFDGNVLVAGTDAARVWRSNDPLATSPTFYVSTETKSPGGASNAIVAYAGANVVAGTAGTESAFSVSTDSGMSFNDISLIDTALTNINDGAVAADGSVKYFASDDGTNLSLWRKAGTGPWQRILSVASQANYIVRIAADDPNVIYIGKPTAKNLYFSKDGGVNRWSTRTSRYNIQDLAIESEDVAYVAQDGTATVSKTVNSGFTWATAKNTELMDGTVHSLTSVGEDQLIAGGSASYVSYSTDGADSWTRIEQKIFTGGGPTAATYCASAGLEPGGYIYAASQKDDATYRWGIGQPQSVPWFNLETPTVTGGYLGYGIALKNGVLYVNTSNGTAGTPGDSRVIRTLKPTVGVAAENYWSVWANTGTFAPNTNIPSNLVVTDGGFKGVAGNVIYVVDVEGSPAGDMWKSCIDTLALAGPAAVAPADGKEVKLNPISGTVSNVALSWNRISEATAYKIEVAYDPGFVEKVGFSGTDDEVTSSDATASITVDGTKFDLGTVYYWRVKATAPVASPWSEGRSLSVESGGTVSPGILAPANGGTVSQTSPSFSWAPVSGATRYEFQLSADTSFAAPLASTQHAAAGAAPDVTLEVGTTYFWRVRAIEPSMGEWSTIANFTVTEAVAPGDQPPVIEIPDIVIPDIVIPPSTVELPEQPTVPAISEGLLWAVIIIGAVLVIALIVLIVRTRRVV